MQVEQQSVRRRAGRAGGDAEEAEVRREPKILDGDGRLAAEEHVLEIERAGLAALRRAVGRREAGSVTRRSQVPSARYAGTLSASETIFWPAPGSATNWIRLPMWSQGSPFGSMFGRQTVIA